jgi:hypothetical protein
MEGVEKLETMQTVTVLRKVKGKLELDFSGGVST